MVLEGEIEATFRGAKSVVKAAHQFRNASGQPADLLCICSPAGQEEFFAQVGIPVATRTTAPAKLDDQTQAEFRANAAALVPKYKTELPQHA